MPKRSAHPGVKLIHRQRSTGSTWYGRFRHPVTERWVDANLTEAGLTTAIERRRWAERKSDELKLTKRARAAGRSGVDTTRVEDAAKAYLDECEHRLRERTVAAYREALESLQAWLKARGRAYVQEISPGDLWAYRSSAIKVAGRKKSTISTHLARLQTALDWWRRAELLPLVSSDAIADACRSVGGSRPRINALRPPQVRALLEAAAAHSEPKAAALVALALLTGMRLGELEGLTWDELDLDAAPGGEVVLGDRTKTHHPRVVDLEVAPAARDLLRALPSAGPYVLGGAAPLSREVAKRWKRQLQVKADEAGRPAVKWTWQHLRQTCGTYLTCAPSIFGASSAFRSARQLGHRVAVAEQHYLGVLRGIPADARTLEAAMEAEEQFSTVSTRLASAGVAQPAMGLGGLSVASVS